MVISDNGRQFIGRIFKDLAKLYGFNHLTVVPYRPQANGMVERTNRVIGDMLAGYVNEKGDDWAQFLQQTVFAYNISKHFSTEQSPYFVVFAREPIIPLDLRLGNLPNEEERIEFWKIIMKIWKNVGL
jgi:transposase InsO family protein